MHDTHVQTDTRYFKTNIYHSRSNLTANHINIDNTRRIIHSQCCLWNLVRFVFVLKALTSYILFDF